MRVHRLLKSKSVISVNQNDLYTSLLSRKAGAHERGANGVGRKTVSALARPFTGGGDGEALRVSRRGDLSYTLVSALYVGGDLVDACNDNDVFGTEDQGRHAIAVPVKIQKLAVLRDGIGAH